MQATIDQDFQTSSPILADEELAELARFDERLFALARQFGAAERQYPALFDRRALERAEYLEAFPHLLMAASALADPGGERERRLSRGNLAEPEWCLSPAVCPHVYAEFAGQTLAEPRVITARGRCFRHEAATEPGVRQIEFEMREIVWLGTAEFIEEALVVARAALPPLAEELCVAGAWQLAEDPFFLPVAQGKAYMQRFLETKLEFQTPGEEPLALASLNRHGSFFGERFEMEDANGRALHTACLAFGLDRWRTRLCRTSIQEIPA